MLCDAYRKKRGQHKENCLRRQSGEIWKVVSCTGQHDILPIVPKRQHVLDFLPLQLYYRRCLVSLWITYSHEIQVKFVDCGGGKQMKLCASLPKHITRLCKT